MRLPNHKRPGDPVLARDWNLLLDAIAARTPRPGPGMELVFGSGGFVYRVRPRAGGSAVAECVPLAILSGRPPYIPAPAGAPAEGSKRYFIEWGTVNDVVATNWDAHFDLSTTTYFFAKITLTTGDVLKVSSWEIETGPNYDSHTTPDWAIGDPRPNSMVVLLGSVFVDGDGRHAVSQNGGGSIRVSEHVTSIQSGSTAGEVRIGKELSYHRLTY